MSNFGDYEPEDAWDAHDAPAEQVRNLGLRIVLLDGGPEPQGRTPRQTLDIIQERVEVIRRRRELTDRERLRVKQLLDDLGYVGGRV